jgi:myo-inositol catabolism protein IolC
MATNLNAINHRLGVLYDSIHGKDAVRVYREADKSLWIGGPLADGWTQDAKLVKEAVKVGDMSFERWIELVIGRTIYFKQHAAPKWSAGQRLILQEGSLLNKPEEERLTVLDYRAGLYMLKTDWGRFFNRGYLEVERDYLELKGE